jgi:hypothetical protein
MPRGDRTGPLGEGPMTGRQMGYGAGYDSPGYIRGLGRGFGRGYFGRGRGRRFFWARHTDLPEVIPETTGYAGEMSFLQSEVQDLKNSMATILERLNKLAPEEKKK